MRGKRTAGGQGDFYEVLPLADGRFALVVGDVGEATWERPPEDKLPGSGSITLARSVLRATVHIDARPSQALGALNRALLAWPAHDRRYVGAVYALVRPFRHGARAWICATGKQPALVHRSDGTVLRLGWPGTPLGLRPDPELRDARVTLRAGDSLVLVTRTLTEAVRAGDSAVFGTDRLCAVLAGLRGASAARSTGAIVRAVKDFCGGQPDRQTVAVVLKVPGHRRRSGTHSAGWPGTRDYLAESGRLP